MLFLKIMKTLALIFAVLSIPLWLFMTVFGALVTFPLIFLVFILDIAAGGAPGKRAFMNSPITYNIAVILGAGACAFGLYDLLTFDVLSGGHATLSDLIISIVAVLPITIALLIVGNRQGRFSKRFR